MWNKAAFVRLAGLLALLMAGGCTMQPSGTGDPKKRLNEYISRSFAVRSVDERAQLLTYLTAEAKERLERWSDDQFREAFMDSKREFRKLVFTEIKTANPQEVNITYELSYSDKSKGSGAVITNKKLCTLIKKDGIWLIKDVRNIKELVEYPDGMEMSLP